MRLLAPRHRTPAGHFTLDATTVLQHSSGALECPEPFMLRQPRCLVFLALALAVACNGTSTVSQADVPHQFAVAQCAKLLACCSGTSGGPTQARCEAKITQIIQASLATAVTKTHVRYDGAAAASCINELKSNTCEDLETSQHSPSCNLVVVGTVALGGQCSTQNECQSRLCAGLNYDGNGNITTPGTCKAQTSVGAACNLPQGTTMGQVCVDGSYEAGSADACVCNANLANGGACTGNERCSSGYCDSASRVCAAYPQLTALTSAQCQAIYSSF